ncbi:hypothetical protein HMI54_014403 [Coelomomyces lativittatus]|nr:hypothetical protein HMI54_014403 [Coelomomyces lativittatus]
MFVTCGSALSWCISMFLISLLPWSLASDPVYFSHLSTTDTHFDKNEATPFHPLETLYHQILQYANEALHWTSLSSLWQVHLESIVSDTNSEELERLICLILTLAVYSPSNQRIVANIFTLPISHQNMLMKQIDLYRCVGSVPSSNPKKEPSPKSGSPSVKSISPVIQSELETLQSALSSTEEKKMEFEGKYQTQVQLNKDLNKKLESLMAEVDRMRSIKDEAEELKQVREALHLADAQLKKYKSKMEAAMTSKKQLNEMEAQLSQSTLKIQQLQEELSKASTYKSQVDQLKKEIQNLEFQNEQWQAQVMNWEDEAQKLQMTHLDTLERLQREQTLVKELEEKLKEMEWTVSATTHLLKEEHFSTLELHKLSKYESQKALIQENENLKSPVTSKIFQFQNDPALELDASHYSHKRNPHKEIHPTIESVPKKIEELNQQLASKTVHDYTNSAVEHQPLHDQQKMTASREVQCVLQPSILEGKNFTKPSTSTISQVQAHPTSAQMLNDCSRDTFISNDEQSQLTALIQESESFKKQMACNSNQLPRHEALEDESTRIQQEKLSLKEAQTTILTLTEEVKNLEQKLAIATSLVPKHSTDSGQEFSAYHPVKVSLQDGTLSTLKEEIAEFNKPQMNAQTDHLTGLNQKVARAKETHLMHGSQNRTESLEEENGSIKQPFDEHSSLQNQKILHLEHKLEQYQQEIKKLVQEKNEIHTHFRQEQQLMASAWYRLQYHRRHFVPTEPVLTILNQESF